MSFIAMLGNLRRGQAVLDADEALAALSEAVQRTGRGGTVTLTLTVKPASKGDRVVVAVVDTVTVKLPAAEKGDTLMYVQEDGSLSRRDPRQPDLPGFRDVSREDPPASPASEEVASTNG